MTTYNENLNINSIARIGSNYAPREYNKAACFEAFRNALENDGHFTAPDLAKLYQFFAPKLPAKPKNDFQWVAQAMGDKDIRHYLNYVYSDGKRLMATDGHRLHLIKNANMKAGYYDKSGTWLHDTDFAKYPDIDRMIVSHSKENSKLITFDSLNISVIEGKKEFSEVYDFDDMRLCSKYINQACQWFNNASIGYSDNNTAVLIEDDNKLAVVMPMRKK